MLAQRFGVPTVYEDHLQLIDAGGLDAVLVAAPLAMRAAIAIDALEAGLHVFVEQPLGITLADVDRIVELRDTRKLVVQVGYDRRFDLAYEQMCANLPDDIDDLLYIEVCTDERDSSALLQPVSAAGDCLAGSSCEDGWLWDDFGQDGWRWGGSCEDGWRQEGWRQEGEQVSAAVGSRTRRETVMFSEVYLGRLARNVNLVHGLLARMNETPPCGVDYSAWWEGPSAIASLRLSTGARWGLRWIESTKPCGLCEQVSLFFADEVHTIAFPHASSAGSAAIYERHAGGAERRQVRSAPLLGRRCEQELLHFRDCVTKGTRCLVPPEQARIDIALLTRMFIAARESGCGDSRPLPFAIA